MMTTRTRGWATLLALALGLQGCVINANLNTGYRPEATLLRPSPLPESLAVRRFADERPPRVYSTTGRGFMTYVPLLPYVALPFERVDESALKAGDEANLTMPPFSQLTYPESMARAIADDLGTSGLFTTVQYVGDGPTDGYRYVLSGTLRTTPVEIDMTSYGLGIVGVLLWSLPIPMGQMWTNVSLDLTLTDTTTGQPVWHRTVTHEYSRWMTLYTSAPALVYGGTSSFNFVQLPSSAQVDRDSLFSWNFEVLRQAMGVTRKEIAAALADPAGQRPPGRQVPLLPGQVSGEGMR